MAIAVAWLVSYVHLDNVFVPLIYQVRLAFAPTPGPLMHSNVFMVNN